MAGKKSNIRSIRFSDEIAEMIDAQIGDTFTDKFTNLITKCCWELPGKEEQLKAIEKEISEKKQELNKLWKSCQEWRQTLQSLSVRAIALENALRKEIESRDL